MAIQVNIFEAGSVPTAQELVTLINELNTTLDESVTLTGEQSITGVKTFLGSKLLKFKQKTTADKLGFTFYDNQDKEVGNFEYDNKNNFRLLALGNYYSATNKEIEGHVGFKVYNKSALSAYRLLCPLAGNAKNSIASLTDTYTNFYMPLIFTNGAASVMADSTGKVDLSTLIGSGGGDVSGLATVATTGDYNDLLNLPTLFSGNYNDLTNKPALFSGDYADLTNKPTIPTNLSDLSDDSTHRLVTDTEKATWNNKSDFSGSYNDLTNKPTIPTVPAISTNITSDAASDTKTASPKAVKDFVEGKGYLTQHQDISGKADQTDLEALEDRVEALEQSGSGSTDEDKCVKLVKDPANYLKASVGDIIKYNGTSTSDFTYGHDYECTKKGNAAYSVSSGDYVLDVAESATNEEFIAAMANETKPFKYSENINWSDYIEYCAVTNPNLILGSSTKTKSNLVVGDVLVSAPYMTPVSVVTEVSGSEVRAKLLSTGYTFSIEDSGSMYAPGTYSYVFTNPEGVKVIITDDDFLTTMTPKPYPPSSNLNYLNEDVNIVGKGTYSGTGTNITITKYYQSAEVAAAPSEWVEAKPCDCSDGGDTTQYSYLKLIPDLDAYTEAPVGEIVKYIGQTNSQYTRGWDYECVAGSGTSTTTIQAGSLTLEVPNDSDINPQTGSQYTVNPDFVEFMNNNRQPFVYSGSADDLKMWKYKVTAGLGYTPYFLFPERKTIQVGEHLYSETGGGIAEITEVASNYIKALYNTKSITLSRNAETTQVTRYMYKNADGAILLIDKNSVPNNSSTLFTTSYALYDYVNNVHFPGGKAIKIVVHPATETVSHTTPPTWQPIIHPSAPVSSGD